MKVVVCVKPVPDYADEELAVARARVDVSACPTRLNEWDAFALEEALLLAEAHGGSVVAVSAGGEECESVLHRALAHGAERAVRVRLPDGEQGDGRTARALAEAVRELGFDLLLTGAQSSDVAGGRTGGELAALLGVPFASLAVKIHRDGPCLTVHREMEGSRMEVCELDLPCAVSVQTGINKPRYVTLRGIRRASKTPIHVFVPGPAPAPRVRLVGHNLPRREGCADILRGDPVQVAGQVAELIRLHGGR